MTEAEARQPQDLVSQLAGEAQKYGATSPVFRIAEGLMCPGTYNDVPAFLDTWDRMFTLDIRNIKIYYDNNPEFALSQIRVIGVQHQKAMLTETIEQDVYAQRTLSLIREFLTALEQRQKKTISRYHFDTGQFDVAVRKKLSHLYGEDETKAALYTPDSSPESADILNKKESYTAGLNTIFQYDETPSDDQTTMLVEYVELFTSLSREIGDTTLRDLQKMTGPLFLSTVESPARGKKLTAKQLKKLFNKSLQDELEAHMTLIDQEVYREKMRKHKPFLQVRDQRNKPIYSTRDMVASLGTAITYEGLEHERLEIINKNLLREKLFTATSFIAYWLREFVERSYDRGLKYAKDFSEKVSQNLLETLAENGLISSEDNIVEAIAFYADAQGFSLRELHSRKQASPSAPSLLDTINAYYISPVYLPDIRTLKNLTEEEVGRSKRDIHFNIKGAAEQLRKIQELSYDPTGTEGQYHQVSSFEEGDEGTVVLITDRDFGVVLPNYLPIPIPPHSELVGFTLHGKHHEYMLGEDYIIQQNNNGKVSLLFFSDVSKDHFRYEVQFNLLPSLPIQIPEELSQVNEVAFSELCSELQNIFGFSALSFALEREIQKGVPVAEAIAQAVTQSSVYSYTGQEVYLPEDSSYMDLLTHASYFYDEGLFRTQCKAAAAITTGIIGQYLQRAGLENEYQVRSESLYNLDLQTSYKGLVYVTADRLHTKTTIMDKEQKQIQSVDGTPSQEEKARQGKTFFQEMNSMHRQERKETLSVLLESVYHSKQIMRFFPNDPREPVDYLQYPVTAIPVIAAKVLDRKRRSGRLSSEEKQVFLSSLDQQKNLLSLFEINAEKESHNPIFAPFRDTQTKLLLKQLLENARTLVEGNL